MRKLLLFTLVLLYSMPTFADEGMWLPSLIGSRISDMKAKGFKLSEKDLYDINKASLKDAIVLFGGGCTGELISDEGLLLTNHHCGYSQIQSHSSVESDFLTNGFWAMSREEELPNPNLSVSMLVRMEDVTTKVLQGVNDSMTESERAKMIKSNIDKIKRAAVGDTNYKASVESLYYGNQYFLFISKVFKDVRLVAAPPSSIGKFGGDTDNWMWPRHTGDFSIFRIYTDKNNQPTEYSPDNVPYKPKRSITISTKGMKENDFTFIYGYPARTTQYLISNAVDYIVNRSNPHKIALRTMRLDVMNEEQAKDPATRIMYASKNASVANAWKKWQGESKGVLRLGTIAKKEALEKQFETFAADKALYKDVLPKLRMLYTQLEPIAFARDYYNEAFATIELPTFANEVAKIANGSSTSVLIKDSATIKANEYAQTFFKNFSPVIDKRISKLLLTEYIKNITSEFQPDHLKIITHKEIDSFIYDMFDKSNFVTLKRVEKFLNADSLTRSDIIKTDPAILLFRAFSDMYTSKISEKYITLNSEITDLYRLYMRGLMEMNPLRTFLPDANFTLRIAYGHIEGYRPLDGIYYIPQTTIDGIMEKDNPDIYDYDIPQALRDIYSTKDYGRWEVDGSVPVAFLATNHTTGGNSGSPVLNAKGELIGLNFDRTWESTMSDIEFDPVKCRNIAVDIRYILFIIDKIGGAGYLLDEMKFAK